MVKLKSTSRANREYRNSLEALEDLSGSYLLQAFVQELDEFTFLATWLAEIFNNVDKYYCVLVEVDSTCQFSQRTFKEVILA